MRVIDIFADSDTSDAKRRKIYDAIEKAISDFDNPNPHDHSDGA
jgi:hypothetical protein